MRLQGCARVACAVALWLGGPALGEQVVYKNSQDTENSPPRPDAVPSVFVLEEARNFVTLSNIAYCDAEAVTPAWDCRLCTGAVQDITQVTYIANDTSKVAGYLGYWPSMDTIVVAFRGSQANVNNWVMDFDIHLVPYPAVPGAMIHRGFYRTYMESFAVPVREGVQALLQQYPNATIALTGHSLGGALATVCAAELSTAAGLIIGQMYTFGSPRVANDIFAFWFNSEVLTETVRMTHKNDIVTTSPWQNVPLKDYHHIGRELWQSKDSPLTFVTCDASGEDPRCSSSSPLTLSFGDHMNYLGMPMGSSPCRGSGFLPRLPF